MNQRQKHTLIAVVVALLGVILILIAGWFYGKEDRFNSYHNAQYGFSIGYPASWEVQENINKVAVVFVSPPLNALDTFRENISIYIDDMSDNPTDMESYTARQIQAFQRMFEGHMVLLKSRQIPISGEVGYQIIFLGKGDGGDVKFMRAWVIKGLKAYHITYGAPTTHYGRYELDMKRMLMSFRIE